jgi:hypothetical protein
MVAHFLLRKAIRSHRSRWSISGVAESCCRRLTASCLLWGQDSPRHFIVVRIRLQALVLADGVLRRLAGWKTGCAT